MDLYESMIPVDKWVTATAFSLLGFEKKAHSLSFTLYERRHNKPLIVFLHGMGPTMSSCIPFLTLLINDYDIAFVEMNELNVLNPYKKEDLSRYNLSDIIRKAEDFILREVPEPALYIATSFGTNVLNRIAKKQPNAKYVFFDPVFLNPTSTKTIPKSSLLIARKQDTLINPDKIRSYFSKHALFYDGTHNSWTEDFPSWSSTLERIYNL
tara:strand:+ start:3308 stop:3937 length:630 start_codon:yes stop_codon:yes gene_type:complete